MMRQFQRPGERYPLSLPEEERRETLLFVRPPLWIMSSTSRRSGCCWMLTTKPTVGWVSDIPRTLSELSMSAKASLTGRWLAPSESVSRGEEWKQERFCVHLLPFTPRTPDLQRSLKFTPESKQDSSLDITHHFASFCSLELFTV